MQTIEAQAHSVNINTVITITARLAQVLAEEVDLLEDMRVKDIEKLQDEKSRLTAALEKQRELIGRYPSLLNGLTRQEHSDLSEVIIVFNKVLKENHKKLMVARDVNERVVGAIRDVVTKDSTHHFYNSGGSNQSWQPESVSITLNKTV